MTQLESRIIEISKKHGLSHNGSCLTAVGIIDEIYSIKKDDEPFILSCGHTFLALAVVLEKYYGYDAEMLALKHGTHPDRDMEHKIWCSTGSLGVGVTVACGMALSDRNKDVYVLLSDGEMFEGSCYETANVAKKYNVNNLKVYVNFNNWGAYDFIPDSFKDNIMFLFPNAVIKHTKVENYNLKGQSAHYVKL